MRGVQGGEGPSGAAAATQELPIALTLFVLRRSCGLVYSSKKLPVLTKDLILGHFVGLHVADLPAFFGIASYIVFSKGRFKGG